MTDEFMIGALVGAIYMTAVFIGLLVALWLKDHRIGFVIEDRE